MRIKHANMIHDAAQGRRSNCPGHQHMQRAEKAKCVFYIDIKYGYDKAQYGVYHRIAAMKVALEEQRLGNSPTENEEVSDFATYLAKKAPSDLALGVPSTLCHSCMNIPIRWLLETPRHAYTLFNHLENITESEKSCNLCKLILRSIENLGTDDWREINIGITPQFFVVEIVQKGTVDDRHLRLCADVGSEAASIGVEIGLPTLPEAGGELHLTLLREWLRDCDENHSDHGITAAKENGLPTRVLDVGNAGNPTLRLYHPTENEKERYIILLHCWGKVQAFTTERTFATSCKAIKIDALPKSFQDAVTVSRTLGVRFLWIDSLCIIQDNDKDKGKAIKQMEEIFASAYCTIAATSAKDSHEGFLNPRPGTQFVRLADKHTDTPFCVCVCEISQNFKDDVENGLLNTRGWVLQERALSRRTIHFTATQTYWECGSVMRYENFTQMTRPPSLLSSSRFPMTTTGIPSEGVAYAFERIFTIYSERDLTYQRDRPNAIAGLQRRMTDVYMTESSNGIIHYCLGRSLLWQRSGTKRMKKIMDQSIQKFPSWSWMRYEGKIRYGNIPKVNIGWNRDVELPYYTSNPQQRVLKAPMVRILENYHIEPQPDTTCQIKDADGLIVGCIRFDCEDEVDIGQVRCIVIAWHKLNSWTRFEDTWKDFADISWSENMDPSNLSNVLVVSQVDGKQGRERNLCYRLGLAVIQSKCLSFNECAQDLWAL